MKIKIATEYEARIRFNWGYHDGANDSLKRKWRVTTHFDKTYLKGYDRGFDDQNNGVYNQDSTEAWKNRNRKNPWGKRI